MAVLRDSISKKSNGEYKQAKEEQIHLFSCQKRVPSAKKENTRNGEKIVKTEPFSFNIGPTLEKIVILYTILRYYSP